MRFKLTIIVACVSLMAQAQTQPKDTTLNRTVVVEQEYNPDIMDARKVNVVPKVEELTVTPRQVEYDGIVSPATSIPGGIMDAYAGKEKQEKVKPGYARLGYGNRGNLDARANYLFDLSAVDKLNLSFAMDGMNGKLKLPDDTKWNHHYYRTKLGLDYLHQFSHLDMNIKGNFGLSNFNLNYAPIYIDPSEIFGPGEYLKVYFDGRKRQKFTSGDVYVGVKSTNKDLPFQYTINTNLLLYSMYNDYIEMNDKTLRETQVLTNINVWAAINEEQQVGVYGLLDNRFYNHDLYKNLTGVTLKPYYTITQDNWRLSLGANVDFRFGFKNKLQVSPDIKAEYIFSDSYVLYAQATGGKIRNDFRHLESANPYASMAGNQLVDTYEQVNGRIGLKASPVSGLWLNLYGGYQNLKDDLYYLETGNYLSTFHLTDANNVYAGAKISYDYKDVFGISVGGKYYNWDADDEVALITKPQFRIDFQTNFRPIPALDVKLGYEYIKREEVRSLNADYLRDPISNLSLGATYRLFNDLSVYVSASNLLNKDYHYYIGYPSQGINFLGGLSFKF